MYGVKRLTQPLKKRKPLHILVYARIDFGPKPPVARSAFTGFSHAHHVDSCPDSDYVGTVFDV